MLEAFRLPSEFTNGRDLFPGAGVVVDVIFFQARGGTLSAIDPDDQFIADGEYFERYPQNILGVVSERQRGKKLKSDDPDAKERRGWVVVTGDFERLPDLQPRPMCTSCVLRSNSILPSPKQRASRGVVRQTEANVEGLSSVLADAVHLGLRVDSYLAYLAANDPERPAALWLELSQALETYVDLHGNPWQDLELRQVADAGNIGAQRFLSAFTKAGDLVEGLRSKPVVEKRYAGRPDDVVAQAEMLYRSNRLLTLTQLALFHAEVGGVKALDSIKRTMLGAGWCLDGNGWNELVPRSVYLTGELWPKYDRAASRPPEDTQAANQARELLIAISPAVYEDIDNLSPRDSWIPLEIIAAWMKDYTNSRGPVYIERRNGLVLPRDVSLSEVSGYLTSANELRREQEELAEKKEKADAAQAKIQKIKDANEGFDYNFSKMSRAEIAAWTAANNSQRDLEAEMRRTEKSIARLTGKVKDLEREAEGSLTSQSIWFLGWLNHDMSTFKPPHGKDEKIDDVRIYYAKEWQSTFKAWLGSHPARRDQIRDVYNRTFKGFVQPVYEPEPLNIARYRPVNRSLHPWQVAGARRILENRGGLLAFDVGVGKTDTALAVIGKARQDGWVKRPVILVPTSIVWKWYKDVQRLYPDYRIGVVGSKSRKLTAKSEQARKAATLLKMGRIDQDGYERAITTSEPDTLRRAPPARATPLGERQRHPLPSRSPLQHGRRVQERITVPSPR